MLCAAVNVMGMHVKCVILAFKISKACEPLFIVSLDVRVRYTIGPRELNNYYFKMAWNTKLTCGVSPKYVNP